MTTFSGRPFAQRLGSLGDLAEGVFEEVYPRAWERFGLERPRVSMRDMPAFIRYSPDYITSHGLVEVQGFGRDQRMKMKTAKLDALYQWHTVHPTTLFLFDSTNSRYGYVSLDTLSAALIHDGIEGAFDNGRNPFLALRASDIPVDEWFPYTPKELS